MENNMTNRQPAKKISRVLYFHQPTNQVVRVNEVGQTQSNVRHHQNHIVAMNSDLFVATKEECQAYLAK